MTRDQDSTPDTGPAPEESPPGQEELPEEGLNIGQNEPTPEEIGESG